MSVVLPFDTPPEPRKQPWLLHILMVNTMNFCSFAQCSPPPTIEGPPSDDELLIAVPNTNSSETVRPPSPYLTPSNITQVDIFHLPSCNRIHTVPGNPSIKGGMVMSISLFPHPKSSLLTVIAGYESGHTVLSQLSSQNTWKVLYTTLAHTQPILSLDVSPSKEYYVTSSADAVLAKHPIPTIPSENTIGSSSEGNNNNNTHMPLKTTQTRHSGQQGLRMRDDGRIFATAGWDSRVRVYDAKSMSELAVLKWHKEGCYAVSFADVVVQTGEESEEGALVETTGKLSVREERLRRARTAHWLAVGSKDGKVSLWDIY